MSALLNRVFACILLLGVLCSCFPHNPPLRPRVEYSPRRSDICRLPSPFPLLTYEELQQPWANEYRVGIHFAGELDFYRAITSFKRARALIPSTKHSRILEIQYYIAYAYYLGRKYQDVIDTFQETELCTVTSEFLAYEDLLIFLSDSYEQCGNLEHAARLRGLLRNHSPEAGDCLELSSVIRRGDLCQLSAMGRAPGGPPLAAGLVKGYCHHRKSVRKAQQLSTLVPGLGYWYVGQKQSAITAFLLNALFIATAYQFFHRGYWAAGAFTTSLEAGWYFGGIYGAGEAAHTYNRLLYQKMVGPCLRDRNLHPVLMLRFGF